MPPVAVSVPARRRLHRPWIECRLIAHTPRMEPQIATAPRRRRDRADSGSAEFDCRARDTLGVGGRSGCTRYGCIGDRDPAGDPLLHDRGRGTRNQHPEHVLSAVTRRRGMSIVVVGPEDGDGPVAGRSVAASSRTARTPNTGWRSSRSSCRPVRRCPPSTFTTSLRKSSSSRRAVSASRPAPIASKLERDPRERVHRHAAYVLESVRRTGNG